MSEKEPKVGVACTTSKVELMRIYWGGGGGGGFSAELLARINTIYHICHIHISVHHRR